MSLAVAPPRVMENAEVHDGADVSAAKDVFHLLAPHVDLVVDDVLGPVVKRASIYPHYSIGPVELPREKPAETAADPGHQHGALGGRRRLRPSGGVRRPSLRNLLLELGGIPEHAVRHRCSGGGTLLNGLSAPARARLVTVCCLRVGHRPKFGY